MRDAEAMQPRSRHHKKGKRVRGGECNHGDTPSKKGALAEGGARSSLARCSSYTPMTHTHTHFHSWLLSQTNKQIRSASSLFHRASGTVHGWLGTFTEAGRGSSIGVSAGVTSSMHMSSSFTAFMSFHVWVYSKART